MAHQMDQRVGAVVGVQEFPERSACAPKRYGRRARRGRFVDLPDKRRQHVTGLEVVIVVRAVEVGRHAADEIRAVLLPISLAKLDPCDLRQGVPFVARLQRAAQQFCLRRRLPRVLGVDTSRTNVEKPFDAIAVGGVDQVRSDRQVLVEEFGGTCAVRHDSADLRGCDEHDFRPVPLEPCFGFGLAGQIDLFPRRRNESAVFPREPPNYRRPEHAPVSGDEDALARQIQGRIKLPNAFHRMPVFKKPPRRRCPFPTIPYQDSMELP